MCGRCTGDTYCFGQTCANYLPDGADCSALGSNCVSYVCALQSPDLSPNATYRNFTNYWRSPNLSLKLHLGFALDFKVL